MLQKGEESSKSRRTGHWLVSSPSQIRGGQETPSQAEDGLLGSSQLVSEDFGGPWWP